MPNKWKLPQDLLPVGKRIAFDCPLDPGLGVRGERDVHVAIDGPDGRRCRSDIVKVRDGTI